MFTYNTDFCNKIAQLSIKKFTDLPKTGKPNKEEWTVLATIIKYNNFNASYNVVALGTGSKCIGACKMSSKGVILNDSHGEVICRRAFLRYLYNEIKCALENDNKSIFKLNENSKLIMKDDYSFHFFISHMPCGDAAIFSKQNSSEFGNCLVNVLENKVLKRSCEAETVSTNKKLKCEDDIFRTGAKCLEHETKQDLKLSGSEYHTLGIVRTKPGRGDPSLSVSCSDKLAKWSFVGIQGALLTLLVANPIYLSSVTIAGNVPYSKESLLRAISNRFTIKELVEPYQHKIPHTGQADVPFEFSKSDSKRPCPSSISWSDVPLRAIEVAVDGRKQGITKKHEDTKTSRLLICKRELYFTFMEIFSKHKLLNTSNIKLSYLEMKCKAELYNKMWSLAKINIFKIWTNKNKDLLQFFDD